MPWREVSKMDERREFVRLARMEGANRRELCRRFGIHPDTAYKWLRRWGSGEGELVDRSRRLATNQTRYRIQSANDFPGAGKKAGKIFKTLFALG